MSNKERNIDILKRIVSYCDEITETKAYFGDSFEVFRSNSIYKNAVAMCVLQIGELSGQLTEGFKEKYSDVPWRNIKGMRNVVAHKYGSIDVETMWETLQDDIIVLRNYCDSIYKSYILLQQEAQEIEYDNEDELER